ISTATLPHVPNKHALSQVLKGLSYILKKKRGLIIISTWKKWQKRFLLPICTNIFRSFFKRKYEKDTGLVIVPWIDSRTKKIWNRKYYLLSKKELFKLIGQQFNIIDWSALGGPNNKDNYFVLANKQ
ncbi:MAG: hypothetical protein ACTSWN_14990, partial [Promethearchaeota archaeon]